MKQMFKRRACTLLLAAAFLLTAGCGKKDETLSVTLVLKTTVDTAEFWKQVMDGVHTAADELKLELTVVGSSAETEIDEQIDIMEDVIQTKPDVIILVSSDFDRMAPVTEQAVAADIPVITMDSDVNTAQRTCFVASDNYAIGRNLGKQMLSRVTSGKVAILSHSTVSSSGIDRAQGAIDAMAASKDITLLGVFDCSNNIEQARSITDELLAEYPDIAGFVCTNEVCNRGAAGCLVDRGQSGTTVVIGCDNSQQQIQYLEQNVIQGIVIQRPFNMGYVAVEQAAKVARGETVPGFVEIPCVTITQDNMYNSENQKLLFPF